MGLFEFLSEEKAIRWLEAYGFPERRCRFVPVEHFESALIYLHLLALFNQMFRQLSSHSFPPVVRSDEEIVYSHNTPRF